MFMKANHDYHLHTFLSKCSGDPGQTVERLISYARKNGLTHLCITDHFWDADVPGGSEWYAGQDLAHILQTLPFPQADGIHISFGCEADMDKHLRLGISPQHHDCFDFINVALTHLHMTGFTIPEDLNDPDGRAEFILRRIDALLDMALPFRKVGIAHLTTPHLGKDVPGGYLNVMSRISESEWARRLDKAARLGCGIELNIRAFAPEEPALRPYRVARKCGCKFFLASDAHFPAALEKAAQQFRDIIDTLQLTPDDRYDFRTGNA